MHLVFFWLGLWKLEARRYSPWLVNEINQIQPSSLNQHQKVGLRSLESHIIEIASFLCRKHYTYNLATLDKVSHAQGLDSENEKDIHEEHVSLTSFFNFNAFTIAPFLQMNFMQCLYHNIYLVYV